MQGALGLQRGFGAGSRWDTARKRAAGRGQGHGCGRGRREGSRGEEAPPAPELVSDAATLLGALELRGRLLLLGSELGGLGVQRSWARAS